MGKAQKKKAVRHRHNPIRVPDSHLAPGLAAANASVAGAKRDAILPIMQKLESPDATDRAWACAAVSNLIHNDPSTRRLLQGKNVVGVLITRLSDTVDEVVAEAAGALRNLAIDGGFDICGEMHNKQVLTPLKALVPKISTALAGHVSSSTPPTAAEGESLSLVFQLTENLVTLFWCLSETSNKALNAINNLGLVPFLMAVINSRSRFPAKLVVASAQCLYVLTDDNTPAAEALHADASSLASILSIARSSSDSLTFGTPGSIEQVQSLRVLCCGILKNISPLPSAASPGDDLDTSVILPLFVPLLGVDLKTVAESAYALASQPTSAVPAELRHAPTSDHKTADEKELERIETQLLTVQLCLEIITGICANLPDWEGVPEGSEDKGVDDEEIFEDEEGSGEEGEDETGDGDDAMMDADVHDRGLSNAQPSPEDKDANNTPTSLLHLLTPPLLALARPTVLSFPPPALPSVHPPTTSVLSAIHVRALECLNNLFVGMKERSGSVEGAGEVTREQKEVVDGAVGVWNTMWSADLLGAIGAPPVGTGAGASSSPAAEPGQERRVEMWNIAVGVLWGLSRMCRGALEPNEEQVKILIALCDSAKDEKIQVQCIGTLGCLAQCQRTIEANLVISKYLLNVLVTGTGSASPRPGIEPTLQAASSLIDVFADEDAAYDSNFREAKMLRGFSDSVKGARKLVRAIDVRKPGGHALRGWADGVLSDMTGFVEYRRKLGR